MAPPRNKRALYSTLNPTDAYPEDKLDGFFNYWLPSKMKQLSSNPDRMSYRIGNSLADSVADAAWKKYLGLEYDEKFLPKGEYDDKTEYGENTVRLPKELEMEIPTDTVMLKNRIATNERLVKLNRGNVPDHVYNALDSDKQALEGLRKTYQTGQPVGISEFSFNSRKWGTSSPGPDGGTPPMNVLHNYNIRYDKDTNRMYYSDTYDFNGYDSWLEGTPFRIRGFVDLNKSK